VNERHPVMPLGLSGHRIPKSILNQAMIEKEAVGVDVSESTESDHDESSDSPWGWKNFPPGLQESVCNKLKTLSIISREVLHVQTSESSQTAETQFENQDVQNTSEVTDVNIAHHEDVNKDEDSPSCSSSLPWNEESKFGGFVFD